LLHDRIGGIRDEGLTGESDQTDALECIAAPWRPRQPVPRSPTGSARSRWAATRRSSRRATDLFISASGATIIAAAGDFALSGGTVTTGLAPALTNADTITLRAPASVGSGTVSVYTINASTGIATLEGTLRHHVHRDERPERVRGELTVKLVADTTCAVTTTAKSAAPAALPSAARPACIVLKDGNGSLSPRAPRLSRSRSPDRPRQQYRYRPVRVVGEPRRRRGQLQHLEQRPSGVATIGIAVTQGRRPPPSRRGRSRSAAHWPPDALEQGLRRGIGGGVLSCASSVRTALPTPSLSMSTTSVLRSMASPCRLRRRLP
jgi:hypothetical protein